MDRNKLDSAAIESKLSEMPGWAVKDNKLAKTFTFKTYAHGVLFAVAVANEADKLDHHPDLSIGYQKVSFAVNTHTVDGISDLDFELARRVESLA